MASLAFYSKIYDARSIACHSLLLLPSIFFFRIFIVQKRYWLHRREPFFQKKKRKKNILSLFFSFNNLIEWVQWQHGEESRWVFFRTCWKVKETNMYENRKVHQPAALCFFSSLCTFHFVCFIFKINRMRKKQK